MTEPIDQVKILMDLCNDIAQCAVEIDGRHYWSTKTSRLGWNSGTRVSIVRSAQRASLQRRGILQKWIVSVKDPFCTKLPKTFFGSHKPTSLHLMAVLDMEKIRGLTIREQAKEFVGVRIVTGPVDFGAALACIKKEIANHPDPVSLFVKVVQEIVPNPKDKPPTA